MRVMRMWMLVGMRWGALARMGRGVIHWGWLTHTQGWSRGMHRRPTGRNTWPNWSRKQGNAALSRAVHQMTAVRRRRVMRASRWRSHRHWRGCAGMGVCMVVGVMVMRAASGTAMFGCIRRGNVSAGWSCCATSQSTGHETGTVAQDMQIIGNNFAKYAGCKRGLQGRKAKSPTSSAKPPRAA